MDPNLQKRMETLFTILHFECRLKRWERVDFLLKRLNNSIHPQIMRVGALRSCFPAKSNLKEWSILLESLVNEMGQDNSRLRGLV